MLGLPIQLIVLLTLAVVSFLGTFFYRRLSIQQGIIAEVNFRSLHSKAIPRGGGLVFAIVFSLGFIVFGFIQGFSLNSILGIGTGGVLASLVGFLDDRFEFRSWIKFLLQIGLGIWGFACFYQPIYSLFSHYGTWVAIALPLFLVFVSVWFINIYNFIDGIDGMAILEAIYISIAAITVLKLTGGSSVFITAFAFLIASALGFVFFNIPPASLFMGDAGSIFLGYTIGILLMTTIGAGQISLWTWIAILGYLIGDTTVTNLYRFMYVKKWYKPHRSHAYQNLARVLEKHAIVTYGVAFYNLCWALPLAIGSALFPQWGFVAALLACLPPVILSLRYGPRFSST